MAELVEREAWRSLIRATAIAKGADRDFRERVRRWSDPRPGRSQLGSLRLMARAANRSDPPAAPSRCSDRAERGDGQLTDARGATPPLDNVFEARLFSTRHELRWTLDAGGGRVVLLFEGAAVELLDWAEPVSLAVERLPELTYLLMGTSDDGVAEGWTRLVAGRTHAIEVPLETAAERVVLRVVEFACRDTAHCNVHLCEESLLRLESAPPPPSDGVRKSGHEHVRCTTTALLTRPPIS